MGNRIDLERYSPPGRSKAYGYMDRLHSIMLFPFLKIQGILKVKKLMLIFLKIMEKQKYEPTQAEIEKAEEMAVEGEMTPEQEKMSNERENGYE